MKNLIRVEDVMSDVSQFGHKRILIQQVLEANIFEKEDLIEY